MCSVFTFATESVRHQINVRLGLSPLIHSTKLSFNMFFVLFELNLFIDHKFRLFDEDAFLQKKKFFSKQNLT